MAAWLGFGPAVEDFASVLDRAATVELGNVEAVALGSTADPALGVLDDGVPSVFDVDDVFAVDRLVRDGAVVAAGSVLVSTATCVVVNGAVLGLLVVTVTPGQSALRPRPF